MFQEDIFKGRNIFITGGGTGLGRSMALRFAELGAGIFLAGRRSPTTGANLRRHSGQRGAGGVCDVRRARFPGGGIGCGGRGNGTRRNRHAGQQRRRQLHGPNGKAFAECVCGGDRNRAAGNVSLHAGAGTKMDRRGAAGQHPEHCDHLCGGELRIGICDPIGVRESRGAGHDAFAGRGMGAASHPSECHCARTVSDRRSVVAADAFTGIRATRPGTASDEAFWAA